MDSNQASPLPSPTNTPAEPATFFCPLCCKFVMLFMLMPHIPACYRQFCQLTGVRPLCTCDDCCGKEAHPVLRHINAAPIKKEEESNNNAVVVPKPPTELKAAEKKISALNSTKSNFAVLSGKTCLVPDCLKSCSGTKGLPRIHVGSTTELRLCMKRHISLHFDEACQKIDELIAEHALTGEKTSSLRSSGEKQREPAADVECCGFSEIGKTDIECKQTCKPILWIIPAKGFARHYFCKTSHLLRYLMKFNCGQGKSGSTEESINENNNSNQKKPKKKKTKRKEPENGSQKTSLKKQPAPKKKKVVKPVPVEESEEEEDEEAEEEDVMCSDQSGSETESCN